MPSINPTAYAKKMICGEKNLRIRSTSVALIHSLFFYYIYGHEEAPLLFSELEYANADVMPSAIQNMRPRKTSWASINTMKLPKANRIGIISNAFGLDKALRTTCPTKSKKIRKPNIPVVNKSSK